MRQRSGHPHDKAIGARVRTLRLQRGLSQSELGKALRVTFQQIQKYEKGANRISAGRLQQIADVLKVPVTFFYSGLGEQRNDGWSLDVEFGFLQTGGAMRLVRAYARIKRPDTRSALVRLAEAVADD
jgi:transcriptional regulator with XRE-family HTH domain